MAVTVTWTLETQVFLPGFTVHVTREQELGSRDVERTDKKDMADASILFSSHLPRTQKAGWL